MLLPCRLKTRILHRSLSHQHETLRFGVHHAGVGQFSIGGDPGSVLHSDDTTLPFAG